MNAGRPSSPRALASSPSTRPVSAGSSACAARRRASAARTPSTRPAAIAAGGVRVQERAVGG